MAEDLLLLDSGTPFAELNAAFVTTRPIDPVGTMQRAVDFFHDRPSHWRLEAARSHRGRDATGPPV
jgi:hypothetical protein